MNYTANYTEYLFILFVDSEWKKYGRNRYICNNPDCSQKAKKISKDLPHKPIKTSVMWRAYDMRKPIKQSHARFYAQFGRGSINYCLACGDKILAGCKFRDPIGQDPITLL